MKTLGILGLVIISVVHGTYFTKQNITSGITFVKEGTGLVSYQRWNALYYYSVKGYLDQTVLFENIIEETRRACELLREKNNICTTLIIRLEKYREKIEHSRYVIKGFRKEGRYKRSFFTAVSLTVSTALSIMNVHQAGSYNEIINQLENNMKTQEELRKDQLSVFKESLVSSGNRFKELTNKIISLNSQVSKINESITDKEAYDAIQENFNFLVQTATLIMMDHGRISDIIVELLTGTSINGITDLLPVNKFLEDLKSINYALQAGKHLPIDLSTENIYELFKIMTVKTTVINNRLLIAIAIPITNTIKYDLYRAIPIPTRVNDGVVVIQPSTEYFLTNLKEDHFIPLSLMEYAKCVRKTDNHIICVPTSPIYVGKHTKCEISILNGVDSGELDGHCKFNIKKIQQQNYFVKLLDKPNLFYVYVYEPLRVRSLCEGRDPAEVLIDQNGMLTLDDGCVMSSNGIIMEATYESGFESKYLLESPEFNVSEFASLRHAFSPRANESKVRGEDGGDVKLFENYDEEFNDLQKRVEQIQDRGRKIRLEEHMIDNLPIGEYSWAGIIVVIVLIMIFCILMNKIIELYHCILRDLP